MPDTIHIADLTLRCIIGIHPEERIKKQDVILNITLSADLGQAGSTDCIEDTVSYQTITEHIVTIVESSEYYLVERLAAVVAETCLADERVVAARIRVEKPNAIDRTRSVGVEIYRTRLEHR